MSFESTQLTLLQGHASLPNAVCTGVFRHLYHHIACRSSCRSGSNNSPSPSAAPEKGERGNGVAGETQDLRESTCDVGRTVHDVCMYVEGGAFRPRLGSRVIGFRQRDSPRRRSH